MLFWTADTIRKNGESNFQKEHGICESALPLYVNAVDNSTSRFFIIAAAKTHSCCKIFTLTQKFLPWSFSHLLNSIFQHSDFFDLTYDLVAVLQIYGCFHTNCYAARRAGSIMVPKFKITAAEIMHREKLISCETVRMLINLWGTFHCSKQV